MQLSAFVSVIIPVFNDNEKLKICLDALEKQTYPSNLVEIIVVDNGSEENVQEVVQGRDQVNLLFEPSPGSYKARNKGLSIAKGEIVAFTDADCIPAPTWLENGCQALMSESNIGLVAGHIALSSKDPNRPNPFELYETLELAFPQDEFVREDHFGVTANLFTFKHILEAVGPFDETLKSGGDREWGQRVFAAGYRQLYAKDARIKHPARDTWEALRKRSIRITGGKYNLLKNSQKSNFALMVDLLLFLKPPFRFFIRTWRDTRLEGFYQKLNFTMVMLRFRWAVIKERLRLQIGNGIPER